MAYDSFSTEKVFANELVNILCNKIIDRVETEFAADKVVPHGDLAAMLGGGAASPLPVIEFAVNDEAVYAWLVQNLKEVISVQTQLAFQNRIQVVTSQAYFEFWMDAAATNTVLNGPYDLTLAEQEFNTSLENELYFQEWKVDVESPIKKIYMIGNAAPDAVTINAQIENHFVTEEAGKYTEFRASAWIFGWNGDYPNLHITGDLADGDLLLSENNLDQVVNLSFQSLSLIDPGNYSGTLEMYVHGKRADSGLWDRYRSRIRLQVELVVVDSSRLMADLSAMYFPHIQSSAPLPAQQLEIITGVNFELRVPPYFEATGGNIQYVETTWDDIKVYTGSGTQTINLQLTTEFDFYEGTELSQFLRIINLDWNGPIAVWPTQVRLEAFLMEQHGFQVDPEALEFFSIKGVSTAPAQTIQIVSTEAFTVSAPYWLKLSATAGNSFKEIEIEPIAVSNLVAGIYEGVVTLTAANASFEVAVMLKVVESIEVGFNANALNFTQDNEEFTNIYSNNIDERANIEMSITRFDAKNFPVLIDNNFKASFFSNKAAIHLGEIISRAFYKPKDLYEYLPEAAAAFEVFPYYRPALVDMLIEKENRRTGFKNNTRKYSRLAYLRGRTPKRYADDYGILNYEAKPVRVTEQSVALFNFVRRFGSHQVLVKRNNVTYKTINHTPGNDSLFGLAMSFSDFVPGDVIEVSLEGDTLAQEFMVFPATLYSHQLYFLNEYNVLEAFEFTGALSLNSSYEAISNTGYKNLVEMVENLEIRKGQRITINSGYILKHNVELLDSIMRSRAVWLVQDGKSISLTPVVKDLGEGNQQATYQYSLEFIINSENDLKVYTS